MLRLRRHTLPCVAESTIVPTVKLEVAQLDDVTLLNLSLTLAVDSWKFKGGVNNLSDEEYRVAGNSSLSTSAGYAEAIYSRPRNWLISAAYQF